jgi:hypothetical protein
MGGASLCRTCAADLKPEIQRLHAESKPVNVLSMARKIFRETNNKAYLLRDIPEELWTRAKHRAVDDGMSLRDLIFAALESYLA